MPKNYPSFDIYPGDILRTSLPLCSPATQGIWFRMHMLMHDSDRYGYLVFKGKPMVPELIARKLGFSVSDVEDALEELDEHDLLSRDGKFIYSEWLINQQNLREKARSRQRNHRNKETTHAPESGANSFSSQDNGHADVTPMSHNDVTRTLSEKEKDKEKDRDRERDRGFSLPPIEAYGDYDLPPLPDVEAISNPERLADDLARSFPATGPKLVTTPPAGAGSELNKGSSELIEEIALATPVALALRWTALTVHGKHSVLTPIINAINLEMREQGLNEREASLWLLKQTRSVTEQVQQEGGWERYWTINRLAKFFDGTEYRNVKTFNRLVGGNGNGVVRSRSASEINRETLAGLRAARTNEGRGGGGDTLPGGGREGQSVVGGVSGALQGGPGGTDDRSDHQRDDERLTGTSNVPDRRRRTPAGFRF